LTDAEGRHYTLYAIKEDSPDKGNRVDLAQYELPPSPPSGMFDIRYGSGRIAEDINSSTKTIDMSGVTYPLTVRVENIDLRFQDETGKNINSVLKSGESLEITNPLVNKLNVTKDILPKEYALEQNYPNPFNPTTTIQFSVPKQTQLKINIYNTLGELVATIADGMYQAGYYKIMFDASKLSSGTYIYRLESSDFVEVKKMILIK
ncbi:MAG: T9SS type A sorting domain-containing protein, partial [Ignavibacteriaceae bacterium]|nr:T9SS type A sorting domain-containing protein [Ignavibacteriaceae bacterium]